MRTYRLSKIWAFKNGHRTMTDDSATARQELPAAPPQELFRDDFGANGGVLAPRTLEEFHQWLSKEVAIWGWVQSVGNAGNFRSVIDGPVALLVEAANQVRTALDIERRGAGPIDHHIEEARRYAARALRDGRGRQTARRRRGHFAGEIHGRGRHPS